MSLIEIHIHGTINVDDIKLKLNTIMATLADLQAKITELETTVNEEQQEVANALAALQQEVNDLKEIIAQNPTPEQVQEIADNIDTIIADIRTTIPNLPDPEPPAEPETPQEPA
jgi:seryl-tRNA synthetase